MRRSGRGALAALALFGSVAAMPGAAQRSGVEPVRAPLHLRLELEGGTELELQGIVLDSRSIGLKLKLVNRSLQPVPLSRRAGLFLLDDLGNRYELLRPSGNPGLIVEPGDRIVAELTFGGPVAAEARRLALVSPGRVGPAFRLEGIEVPEQAAGLGEGEAATVAEPLLRGRSGVDMSGMLLARHPGGAELGVRRVELGDGWIAVGFTVQNHSRQPLEIDQGAIVLRDGRGRELRATRPMRDHVLRLEPEAHLDAELTFLGRLRGAETLTLVINDSAPAAGDTLRPRFEVPGVPMRDWRAVAGRRPG
jgi:hypothetical protein